MSFRHIGSGVGLSHNTVQGVAQDSTGYVWIATLDGLNRYDGSKNIKVYRVNPGDSLSIASNRILGIVTDPSERLWVLTPRALSLYNPSDDSFRNYPLPSGEEAVAFCPMSADELLLATEKSLLRLDVPSGSIERLPLDNTGAGAGISTVLCHEGRVYVGGKKGAFTYDADNGRCKRLPGLPDIQVNSLYAGGNGRIYAATEGDGLYMAMSAAAPFAPLEIMADNKELKFARAVLQDESGRLWIGTYKGLFVYNPQDSTVTVIKSTADSWDSEMAERLQHSTVSCIYADRQGGMWIGTYYGGVDYYHPLQSQFRSLRRNNSPGRLNDNIVSCIEESPGGQIFIGTNSGGVNIYDPTTNRYSFIKNGDLPSNDIKALHIDPDKSRLYVGMNHGGIAAFDLNGLRRIQTAMAGLDVYAIRPNEEGNLWVGTLDGLYVFNPSTGLAVRVRTDASGNPLQPTAITDIFKDSEGRLWLSGPKGVRVYRENDGAALAPVKVLDGNHLLDYYVNSVGQLKHNGDIWVSSRDGLYIISRDATTLRKHLTVSDGLPNDITYGVLDDDAGNLWISTNYGLSRYTADGGTFRNYSDRDYLPFNQFSQKSYKQASDGTMFFGGVRGLVSFNPGAITPNTYSPKPIISGVKLFDNPVAPGDESGILDKSIEQLDRIELKPGQSMVSFDFTVCNFSNGNYTRYAYMLDGYDKDWIETGDSHSDNYRNLPPGLYTFKVKASNSDGLWSEERLMQVRVLPQWYQLWWVQFLFAMTVMLVGYLILRYLMRRKIRDERLEFERRDIERQREVNDMKINFFVNMSHELRTPLTLILLPATELLEQKRNDPKVTDKLETIRSNTLRILNIINQMLDYQRAESGMFPLNVAPQDVNTLLRGEFDIYRQAAMHHSIVYKLDSTVGDAPLYIDRSYLSIILGNLLSNAFKHTPDGHSITLRAALSDDESRLMIEVSDTGTGIPADKLPDIFERFYKANVSDIGSGIGLALVGRLISMHHGQISVDSCVGEGTVFRLSLPVKAEAYAPGERSTEPVDVAAAPRIAEPVEIYTPQESETPAQAPEAESLQTVLLVDDNESILKYISESLMPEFNVLCARSGKEALAILAEKEADIIITDVMMPDMDGVQLCKAVKRNLRTSHISVIMLSAKSEVSDQLEAMKVGADDYLPKPFSMPLLKAKIANRLRTRARAIAYYNDATDIEPEKMAMNPIDQEFLTNAKAVVEKHLDDSEFTTEKFAFELLVSRTNLHLKLKALTGESANEFIRRMRMNKAVELLKTGRYSVSEVSVMVGYSTASYFSTSFKKFFGELPSDYVKN